MGNLTITGGSSIVTSKGEIFVALAEETEAITNFGRVWVTTNEPLKVTILALKNNNVVDFHSSTYGENYVDTRTPMEVVDTTFHIENTGATTAIALVNGTPKLLFTYVSGTNPQFAIPIVLHRLNDTYTLFCVRYEISNAYFVGVVTEYAEIYSPQGQFATDFPQPSIIQPQFFEEWEKQNRGDSYILSYNESLQEYLSGLKPPVPPGPEPKEDPYNPGGESGEEGGEGNFDNTSDEIEIPDLPTASTVINTGFITLYDANIYDLNELASYLWSANGLDLETFKKIFADPISAILGLSIFPCSPEITTQDVNVILGNIDTGVGMRRVTNQYRRYDMGTLNLNEYWGGYLDYSPYTSVEIYLPYIGTRTLNADDVMGKALHLVYNIDFLSGSCCAILEVGGTVLYQFMGQCSCPVPVTGRDMTNLVNGVMSVVGAGVGTLVATGGNAALAGASAIGSLASHVTSSKPKIEKSGAMGGMGGMLGVRKPYLVVTRPRQALPASQNTYTGYPSYMTCMLGDLIGFTVMETVHLQDMSATDEEKAEIDRLLKTGVVL